MNEDAPQKAHIPNISGYHTITIGYFLLYFMILMVLKLFAFSMYFYYLYSDRLEFLYLNWIIFFRFVPELIIFLLVIAIGFVKNFKHQIYFFINKKLLFALFILGYVDIGFVSNIELYWFISVLYLVCLGGLVINILKNRNLVTT